MRAIRFLFVVFVAACAGHHDAAEFDLEKISEISEVLLEFTTEHGQVEVQWWPKEIAELKPKEIRSTEEGIYIELRSFFGEESGLFIPASKTGLDQTDPSVDSTDPSYRPLYNNIYSYHIKG